MPAGVWSDKKRRKELRKREVTSQRPPFVHSAPPRRLLPLTRTLCVHQAPGKHPLVHPASQPTRASSPPGAAMPSRSSHHECRPVLQPHCPQQGQSVLFLGVLPAGGGQRPRDRWAGVRSAGTNKSDALTRPRRWPGLQSAADPVLLAVPRRWLRVVRISCC